MNDPTLADEEARKAAQRDAVKSNVQSHVNHEITHQAAGTAAGDKAKVDAVAAQFRDQALDETVRTDRAVGHARTAARSSQFIDYGFYVLYSLLAIRLVLALIAARSSNGFVQFIGAITGPFYAPFRGIVGSPSAGGSTLVVPIVIALVVYVLLHAGINGALRMVAHRKTEI